MPPWARIDANKHESRSAGDRKAHAAPDKRLVGPPPIDRPSLLARCRCVSLSRPSFKMGLASNIYFIAGVAVVGGGLFGTLADDMVGPRPSSLLTMRKALTSLRCPPSSAPRHTNVTSTRDPKVLPSTTILNAPVPGQVRRVVSPPPCQRGPGSALWFLDS